MYSKAIALFAKFTTLTKTEMRILLPIIAFLLIPLCHWAQTPIWTQAYRINNGGNTTTIDFERANDGCFYHMGSFSGNVNFSGKQLSSAGNNDIYLVKTNSGGKVQWAASIGGNNWDQGADMAVDDSANVYITGSFTRQFIAGNDTFNVSGFAQNGYLTKIDSSGNIKWTKIATGTSLQMGKAVITDDKGYVYWAGDYFGSSTVAGRSISAAGNSYDIFMAKISNMGKPVRVNVYGGNSTDQVIGLALEGKVLYMTGNFFSSNFKIGNTTLSTSGGYDVFLARMDTASKPGWFIKGGSTSNDQVFGIHASDDGSVALTGTFQSAFAMGNTSITGSWADNFAIRIAANARATFLVKLAGSSGFGQNVYSRDVYAYKNGLTLVGGYFSGSLSIGSNNYSAKGGTDVFVAAINKNGALSWLNLGGGNNNEIALSLTADSSEYYYVGGYYSGSTEFDKVKLSGSGTFNNFVAIGIPPVTPPNYNGLRNRVVYADSTFARSFEVKPKTEATYTLIEGPTGATLTSDSGFFSFTPTKAQIGKHKVVMQAENIGGKAKDSFTIEVIVPLKLELGLPNYSCLGEELVFEQANKNVGPLVINFEFGDGTKRTTLNSHEKTYQDTGLYIIKMLATNFFGVKDSLVDTIYVAPLPKAKFEIETACKNDTLRLANTSTVARGTITNTIWRKNNITSGFNFNYKEYSGALDTNMFKIVVESSYGCKDSLRQQVITRNTPTAGFSTFNACAGDDALFFDNSNSADDTIAHYIWEFGDGKTRNVDYPSMTYSYDAGGNFKPQLTVITKSGCANTYKTDLTVYEKPTSIFSVEDLCFGETLVLDDKSTTPVGTISQRRWTTGDGKSYVKTSVNHNYKSPGKYKVSLVTSNTLGCTDTLTTQIIVAAKAKAKIISGQACEGTFVSLSDSSTKGVNDNWIIKNWFQDGKVLTSGEFASAFVGTTPSTIKLVVSTEAGCKDSIEENITPLSPIEASFSIPNGCEGDTLRIDENFDQTNLERVVWVGLGMKTISKDSFWQVVYTRNDNHQLFARTVAKNGCQDSAIFDAFEVYHAPEGGFSYTIDTPSKTVNFTSLDTIGNSYEWDFDNGAEPTISASKSVSQAFNQNGIYNVSLIAKTDNGCATKTDSVLLIFFSNSIDNSKAISASVYPNPATQFVQIALDNNNHIEQWQLSNINGQTINSGITNVVNIANLSEGIYLLKVQTEQGIFVKQIQKL
jgi:PKD repeat protein